MFSFDQAALPQLTTRKALIVVDFQNDFVGAADGGLPVTHPEGFVHRTTEVAAAFRSVGDIIWVQSRFDKARQIDGDQIILSEDAPSPRSVPSPKQGGNASIEASSDGNLDPEAFLSFKEPFCVKSSHPGSNIPLAVAETIQGDDLKLTKSYYSAFHGTQLLRMLRGKMVMEVFICGSLTNIGVYATAMDAAGHGMAITVIEDCCGYRHESRRIAAMKHLVELTGCDISSSQEVLGALLPNQPEDQVPNEPATISSAPPTKPAAASDDEDIVQSLMDLKLSPGPSGPTAATDGTDPTPIPRGDSKDFKDDAQVKMTDPEHQTLVEDDAAGRAEPALAVADPENGCDVSPLLQHKLCEGDTDIIQNALPNALADEAFDRLEKEVVWQRMSHQGGEVPRLVAVQGEASEDGTMPVYRHPADESPPLLPFSPTVQAIRTEIEKHLGHPLNHVLIQFYRDGNDYISEHSDKTLDIVRGSYIANVSLGAERTMILRTKKLDKDPSGAVSNGSGRKIQRARLSHNSLCRMGLQTNMKWLHAIRRDKRADRDKSAAELAYAGRRISLTFRHIGTFLDRDESIIWGQGATGKTRASARPITNGQSPDAVRMIQAFGMENHASDFGWHSHYGGGFDVLHISSSPRFFASADAVVNMCIVLMLTEYGIKFAKGSMASAADLHGNDQSRPPAFWSLPVKFIDNDAARSVIQGDVAIMLYLYYRYGPGRVAETETATQSPAKLAKLFSQLQRGLNLLNTWRQLRSEGGTHTTKAVPETLKQELAIWDGYIADNLKTQRTHLLCEDTLTLPDFALWPVLHSIVEKYGLEAAFKGLGVLRKYYETVRQLDNVAATMGNP
ncbi:isochorismatase family [Trichoderma cornu-damae]|uniref:Isochorismatase family n=1 Tax=Trichoderma cornu-damae TaxID=654480 RepID=A0A9P8TWV8_9HYPO|nr:isochorismatase family [Trichoderma cornu-damae]